MTAHSAFCSTDWVPVASVAASDQAGGVGSIDNRGIVRFSFANQRGRGERGTQRRDLMPSPSLGLLRGLAPGGRASLRRRWSAPSPTHAAGRGGPAPSLMSTIDRTTGPLEGIQNRQESASLPWHSSDVALVVTGRPLTRCSRALPEGQRNSDPVTCASAEVFGQFDPHATPVIVQPQR